MVRILDVEREGIAENRHSFFEANAVLLDVRGGFGAAPFKT